jgi:hypothetical protein
VSRTRAAREAATGRAVAVTPDRIPEAVAPAAVYLTTDEARGLSGQVFLVVAGQITHYAWPPAAQTLFKPGRWTLDELAPRFATCFGSERGPAVAPKYLG